MSTKTDNMQQGDRFAVFGQLGVSAGEQRTLHALFKAPQGATVVELQRILNIPRPTIYSHLEELERLELVVRGTRESGSVFYPASVEAVERVFKERASGLTEAALKVGELYQCVPGGGVYNAKFTVLDKGDVANKIFWGILRDRPACVQWFWPVKHMLESVSDDTFKKWYEERVKRNIRSQILWPHKQRIDIKKHPILGSGSKYESLREVRVLPQKIDATMGYAIYGNKVAYLSSQRENYGIIIDSVELANLTRSQFAFLWGLSKSTSSA